MPPSLFLAVTSALATLAIWIGLILGIFYWIGSRVASYLTRRIPKNQDHIPPRLVWGLTVLTSITLGFTTALHAALPSALLAGGDASLTGHLVLNMPWPSSLAFISDFTSAAHKSITPLGVLLMIGRILLGPLIDAGHMLFILGQHLSTIPATDPERALKTWVAARPALEMLARDNATVSALVATVHTAFLILIAIIFTLLTGREIPKSPQTPFAPTPLTPSQRVRRLAGRQERPYPVSNPDPDS